MILRLVRRDPAWQMALTMAIAIGVGVPVFATGAVKNTLLAAVAMAITVGVLRAHPHVHATPFEVALPIGGRDLFAARTLSLLALVWGPILCGVAATLMVRQDGGVAFGLLEAAAIVTPWIVLQQAMHVGQIAGPPWWSRFGWAPTWAAGGAAWYFLSPGVVLTACGAVTAALLIRAWYTVPPSLQFVSLETRDAASLSRSVPAARLTGMAFTWAPVFRPAFWGMPTSYFVLMIMQGILGGWFYFFCIFVCQGTATSRKRTQWLTALPISYSGLLRITLASAVLPLLAGLAIGMCFHFGPDTSMSAGATPKGSTRIHVPLEFWRQAPGGKAPVIEAPWGETVEPTTTSVAGFTLYNPYSVSLRSSRHLLDWQFERATLAIYGRPVAFLQYDAAEASGLRPRTDGLPMRILTLEGVAFLALSLVFATELTNWHRLRRFSAIGRAILLWTFLGVPAAAVLGIDLYYRFYGSFSIGQALFDFILLRLTSAVPNSLLAAGLAALPIGAIYCLLERQFRKCEVIFANRPANVE